MQIDISKTDINLHFIYCLYHKKTPYKDTFGQIANVFIQIE